LTPTSHRCWVDLSVVKVSAKADCGGARQVRRRTAVRLAGLLALTSLAVLGGWAWTRPSTALVLPGDGSYGVGLRPADAVGTRYVLGAIILCTQGPSVTLTGVRPAAPSRAFTIEAWGTRPDPMARGGDSILSDLGTLSGHGFQLNRGRITLRCDDRESDDAARRDSVELAIQVSKREAATAWTVGLLVDYTAGRRSGKLLVPGTYSVCGVGPGPPSNSGLCPAAGP
jgi:hypothetical protein